MALKAVVPRRGSTTALVFARLAALRICLGQPASRNGPAALPASSSTRAEASRE
jgi:hypothetical protein